MVFQKGDQRSDTLLGTVFGSVGDLSLRTVAFFYMY